MSDTYEKLNSDILNCSKCPRLVGVRKQILGENHHPITPSGNINSDILIVGQAPGRKKPAPTDVGVTERPFAIGSGDMLDEALSHIKLTRNDVFIANILNCNTPEDKTFTDEEIHSCKPFLARIMKLQNPRIIVALGKFALQHLAGNINMQSGSFKQQKDGTYLVYLFHPAYIQRNMSMKQQYLTSWEILNSLRNKKSSLKNLLGVM